MPKGIYQRTKRNSIAWTFERKKAFSEKWSGENSPFWKGGLTTNKEYRKEYNRKWIEVNKERVKYLTKRSHDKNRERYLLLKKLWQKNNYAKSLENNRKYRTKHPEKVKAWRKKDYETHKERINFQNRQREDRERNAVGRFTFEEWTTLKTKYNNECVNCKKQESEVKLTRDHIMPLIKGGSNTIDNIQPLCGSCNSSKNDNYINYL